MTRDGYARLVVGEAYQLAGIKPPMWGVGHPLYGTPEVLAGRYLGSLPGTRRWHGFEIWSGGKERGVIFMNDQDLEKLDVTHIVG